MCVAAFAWAAHPRWLLIAIGNRDEFHERPAAPLARWDNGILAGRDLQSGGTWLGVSKAGRFALVTNLRGHGGPEPDRASRGTLVTDLLTGSGRYADPAIAPLQDFNPFNLILADSGQAQFLSNRPEDIRTGLAHGIYGLSNGTLDEPWPKTLQLKGALLDWLNREGNDFEPLFAALRDEHLADVGVHPREPSDVPREAPETPVFIRDPIYGTRCSTVVAIGRGGRGTIIERRFSPQAESTGETTLAFDWPH
ncbi:MAG: NRDE family protein [Sphingomonadales bacterium]|nr:NRDE family protein [Sphingomonadales bacterium]